MAAIANPFGTGYEWIMRPTVLIFGGVSDERLVSVATAQNLAITYPFNEIWFIHADGSGISRTTPEELIKHERPFEVPFQPSAEKFAKSLSEAIPLLKQKTVFIGLHGTEGEDGTLQALLEKERIPFTGSSSESSRLCFDKKEAKRIVRKRGLRVAAELELKREDGPALKDQIREFVQEHGKIVIKPVASGSSFGLHILEKNGDPREVVEAITASVYDRYLAEAFIKGREITVGVLDSIEGRTNALPCSETVLLGENKFDYAGKYLGRGSKEITPADLAPEEAQAAQKMAIDAHLALGCYGYTRTDMILTESGPVYLETNTLPGLTRASFIPQQLEAKGIKVRDFIEDQLKLAEKRG